MLLDPWLLTYASVLWDRWECLRLAFEAHPRLDTVALAAPAGAKPAFDYTDFVEMAINDRWNHRLFLDILRSQYPGRCAIAEIPDRATVHEELNPLWSNKPVARTLKRRLVAGVEGLLGAFTNGNKAVFYSSFFPIPALVKLNLSLGQLPRLHLEDFVWPAPLDTPASPAGLGRGDFRVALKPRDAFEAFVFERVFRDLPAAYWEGFASLQAKVREIRLTPKVILTANAHWNNEVFKLWCAESAQAGVKIVVMQHGGSVPPEFNLMGFEEDISDVKTTWSVPFHPKHRRLPANKLAAAKIASSGETLAVLGLEVSRYPIRVEAAPVSAQALTSTEYSCELHDALTGGAKAAFRVKPFISVGWNTRQRYIDALGADKVSGERDFRRFLASARIIVCTYPQTTFSEGIASGIPTIALYPRKFWDVIPEFEPLVEQLRAAKIIFNDPKAAAAHIDAVWADPARWWESPEVLRARAEFKRLAVNFDPDWLKPWSDFINSLAP